jgi:hypothetical protein
MMSSARVLCASLGNIAGFASTYIVGSMADLTHSNAATSICLAASCFWARSWF